MSDYNDVRAGMTEALGIMHGLDTVEVEARLTDLGDDYLLELDSKEAEFLLVAVEEVVGQQLPTPADLGLDSYGSLGALIDAVLKEVQ